MLNLDNKNNNGKCKIILERSSSGHDSPELCDQKRLINETRRAYSIPNYFSKVKCVLSDEHTEDENESDISSSFSLQECMNEFRARRIRRTNLNQQRQNEIKEAFGKTLQEATEIDLINQNLCNKEQERKCKPCRDGFCYCFTSDSGDGGNHNGCQIGGLRTKPALGSRRSECIQFLNSNKPILKNPHVKNEKQVKSNQACQTSLLKCTRNTNNLTVISSVEESAEKSPLIHIIHEIHENSVISKVKFNKTKLQTFEKLICPNKKSEKQLESRPEEVHNEERKTYSPTAPSLDSLDNQSDIIKKVKPVVCSNTSERRRYLGGQLLQKRFVERLRYKQKDFEKVKADSSEASLSSTDTSVREAERVLDTFLENNGYRFKQKTPFKHDRTSEIPKNPKKIEVDKKNICPKAQKKVVSTYQSLKGVEKVNESKRSLLQNSTKKFDVITEMEGGVNETKLKDMLNFDANTNPGVGNFHTSLRPAQAQHSGTKDKHKNEKFIGWTPPKDNPKDEKLMGWTPPHKINLDTVDGAVHHNLASNYVDKNTPVKRKITSPNQNLKVSSEEQNSFWSEKLKHLSPWSNKTNKNYNKNERKPCSRSKAFIRSSKTKFMHFISPKKDQKYRKSSYRHFGAQTSPNDNPQTKTNNNHLNESSPQSAPETYNSPIQSSHTQYHDQCSSSISTLNKTEQADFDFSRTVHIPSKKVPRASQRKLDFPLSSTVAHVLNPLKDCEKKTYRSFNSELDQDISISKINYILNNIRSRLEESDQRAICTFQQAETTVDQSSIGIDCPDNLHEQDTKENENLPKYITNTSKCSDYNANEPIYSEIVDENIYLSEGPEFENHTSIQHYGAADNPEILYTKVNKCQSGKKELNFKQPLQPIPLGNIIMDSFRSKTLKNLVQPKPHSVEKHPSYLPFSSNLPLSHCQSLNNVRSMEQNSYPNKQKNLNKSDLSLQRSELFLQNLCTSELAVDPDCGREVVEKVQNDKRNSSNYYDVTDLSSSNDVFYAIPQCEQPPTNLPNEEIGGLNNGSFPNSTPAGSNLQLSSITSPSSNNQSTLKKRSFVTKDESSANESRADAEGKYHLYNAYKGAPPINRDNLSIPIKQNQTGSPNLNERSYYESLKKPTMKKYKSFKNVLRKSFRKSKKFVKEKGKLFSKSANIATFNPNVTSERQSYTDGEFNIEDMISFNESASISEQIAQAVSVCRQLPDLESSMEMVEAERLLLFSSLRRKTYQNFSPTVRKNHCMNQKSLMRFCVNEMHLPVLTNVEQDIFFNFFYIVTFECGDVVISSQSAGCQNGVAVFRDNGIELICSTELDAYSLKKVQQTAVKCNIFMLRLRKLSTITIEEKQKISEREAETDSTTPRATSSVSSDSSCGIVSRFKLQASFTLDAKDFSPYEYVEQESKNSDRICIRSSCLCSQPLTSRTKSTSLLGEIQLNGRAEIYLPKLYFDGFLDVQDPCKQHYWNRRYCTLDGIFLYVWQDKSSLNISPLISIDLRCPKHYENYPLTCSPRELCARPRSFYLDWESEETTQGVSSTAVFFSADTQTNLDNWLKNLNTAMDFIVTWLK